MSELISYHEVDIDKIRVGSAGVPVCGICGKEVDVIPKATAEEPEEWYHKSTVAELKRERRDRR